MIAASIAASFASCQKQDVEIIEDENVVSGLVFSSEKPAFVDETKTEWTGETIQWSAKDRIRVAYTCDGVWQNADGTAKANEENGSKTAKIYASTELGEATDVAEFSVPTNYFTEFAKGKEYVFFGVYPSTAISSTSMESAPSVTVTIPAEQTPLLNSFDSKADLMAAKSTAYSELPQGVSIPLMWSRLVAHGHFTLKGLKVDGQESISTITLTANSDADMVGTHYLYLDTYNVEKPNSNVSPNVLTVNGKNLTIDASGNVTFWTCFLPCTWTSITVRVETDKATYTREIDLTGNVKTFVKNARNILAINMASAAREAIEAAALPFEMDFSGTTGTNGLTELEGFKTLDYVYRASGAIRLAHSDYDGLLETKMLDLSNNFHVLVTAAGWDSDELAMTVSAGNESHDVTLKTYDGVFAEYLINFSPVNSSSSVKFAAAKGKRCYIKDIKIRSGHETLSPVIIASVPKQVAAAGGSASFTYILMNPKDGNEVSASTVEDWITDISVDDVKSIISYTVAENTSETPREGVILLSYGGKPYNEVTISQEAKLPDGEKKATYTIISKSEVTTEGSAPIGSTATYSSTYSSKCQLTKDNSMTLTLTGYDGCTITGITLSMKSNKSSGAGTLSVMSGQTLISSIADNAFNTTYWNNAWSSDYVDITPSVTPTVVGSGEKVVITLAATASSLYCQSITIDYKEPVN